MRQTKNTLRRTAPAILSLLVASLAAPALAAPLSMSDVESNGVEAGTEAQAGPAKRAQAGPADTALHLHREGPGFAASSAGADPTPSKAVLAAREADAQRRALLDEELRANPAQVIHDAPPAAPTSAAEPAQRSEPARARDEDIPLSGLQKSFMRSLISTVREVVQHPLTWVAVALLGVAAAVLSMMGRQRRDVPASQRRAPGAAAPASARVVATVRHRPRRRH